MPSNNSNIIKRTILIIVCSLTLIIFANGAYWVFSDIQQCCYAKVQQADFSKDALNTYEKCSMYTINLAICAFGYPVSREATIQQIFTLFPTSTIHEWHSRGLFDNPKTQALMARYPRCNQGPSDNFVVWQLFHPQSRQHPLRFGSQWMLSV